MTPSPSYDEGTSPCRTPARGRRLTRSVANKGSTMATLLPAEITWYATGRFYEADDKTLAD